MRKSPLLIYSHGGGRLGNQLLVFSHLLSWYWENPGYRLMNLSFWEYAELFNTTQNNAVCYYSEEGDSIPFSKYLRNKPAITKQLLDYVRYPALKLSDWHLLYHRVDVGFDNVMNLSSPEFNNVLDQNKIVMLSGWQIRCWDLLKKYQDDIRSYFTPLPKYSIPANKFMQRLKENYDLIIGIYIRQEDYKKWLNGRFYFETEDYLKWMKELYDLYADKKVCFLVAGNGTDNTSVFKDLPCEFATGNINAGGHYLENIIELSQCDLILSVPSTFSTWAAFMGDTPIVPVVSKKSTVRDTKFMNNHLFDAYIDPEFSLAVQ
jgi:hypothetical protein